MITCEKCGGVSSVLDSRPVHTTVRRRRRCDACGHRWSTFEIDRDLMLSIGKLPEGLSALAKATLDIAKASKDVAVISELVRGGQGPIKTKRKLTPRSPREAHA